MFLNQINLCLYSLMPLMQRTAPFANTSLERAVCFTSTISSCPANITVCSPKIVPPLIDEIPTSFLFSYDE